MQRIIFAILFTLLLRATGNDAIDRIISSPVTVDSSMTFVNQVVTKLHANSSTVWSLTIDSLFYIPNSGSQNNDEIPSIKAAIELSVDKDVVTVVVGDKGGKFFIGDRGYKFELKNSLVKQQFWITVAAVKQSYQLSIAPGAAVKENSIISSFPPFSYNRHSFFSRMLFSIDHSGVISKRMPEMVKSSTMHQAIRRKISDSQEVLISAESFSDTTGLALLRFTFEGKLDGMPYQITTDGVYHQGKIGFFNGKGIENVLRDPEYRFELLAYLQPLPQLGNFNVGLLEKKITETAQSRQTVMTPAQKSFSVNQLDTDNLFLVIGQENNCGFSPIALVWNVKNGLLQTKNKIGAIQ